MAESDMSKCKRNNAWMFCTELPSFWRWERLFSYLMCCTWILCPTSQFPSDSGRNSSAYSQDRDLITCWKCRWAPFGCSPLWAGVVPAFALWCGSGCLTGGQGWQVGGTFSQCPSGDGTLLREGERGGVVLFPQDYLYPALVQSGRFVDETGSCVEEKSPPGPNAFCLLQQLPNKLPCVSAGMGPGLPLLGNRLEAVSRKACNVLQRTISVSWVWKNNVPGHEYYLSHTRLPGWGRAGHDQGAPWWSDGVWRPGLR